MGTRGTAEVTGTAVTPWRLTRTLAVASGALVIAAIWFSIGLTRRTPDVIGWLPPVVSVAVSVRTAWQAGRDGRTFWRYVAIGVLMIGLASAGAAYDYFSGDQQGQHISGPTAAMYVAGLLVMLAGLLRIPGAGRTRIEWTRFGLDIATVIVTVLTFGWHLFYRQWQGWAGDTAAGMITVFIVVAAGLVCVSAFVKVAFTGTGPIDRRALHLLALTGAVGAGGGALTPLLASRPYLNNTHILLPAVCLVLCLAADRQLRASRAGRPLPRPLPRRLSVMPYAAVLLTAGLLLISAAGRTSDLMVVAVGAVTVTLLVAGRQMVALRDNVRLLDDLDARQRELAHRATHDVLTDLPNRAVLLREVAAALTDDLSTVSVALIDLDDFKAINDDLGHAVGDALLIAVAERIVAQTPHDGMVARLGGDEYALLLRGGDTTTPAAIAAHLRLPLHAADHELVVEASIGVARARAGDTADELLRRADVAMYEAKSQGKGRQVVYSAEMDQRSAEQARLAADLRTALDTGQLQLHYQPIVALPGGELHGVEALIRWTHPERGPIGPGLFIPAAERTGLIVPLGAWILEEACRQAARWAYELGGAAPRTVSVNVSARQLREAGFAGEVAAVLRRTGLAPHMLTVEVTETAVFDGGTALTELHAIAALGVSIALDDFGTGHSSLGLLRTCPADILKVDKSFIDDITEGGQQAVVAAALIRICAGMNLRAVAEGVETAEQAAELYRLGYRFAQGYHFARPLPAEAIAAYRPMGAAPGLAA
ncbi:diguanylate cyclase (GGDEF)-like protein [Actinoplanes lutulentus]|uniref:Diguanylate cyclase (GGDEF)-like protein n=1 Tax=Actinoplanes lutulentus TaxID=1287878 RepID=A0A327Z9F5_9ACTN|nr:EAL domain-containing protein [Actinoplanes lutulentus]MBB2946648.1 diguanylate cyclase (GGDEF)-like protein [Actinoplanes lutulentus]RAK35542.1 diguanylate cyclase (GGDEF)-like protein [Actinoplanes lutulentus]